MFRKKPQLFEQPLLITFLIVFTAVGPETFLTATDMKNATVRIRSRTVLAHSVAVGAGAFVAWVVAGVVVFVGAARVAGFLVGVPIHSGAF